MLLPCGHGSRFQHRIVMQRPHARTKVAALMTEEIHGGVMRNDDEAVAQRLPAMALAIGDHARPGAMAGSALFRSELPSAGVCARTPAAGAMFFAASAACAMAA